MTPETIPRSFSRTGLPAAWSWFLPCPLSPWRNHHRCHYSETKLHAFPYSSKPIRGKHFTDRCLWWSFGNARGRKCRWYYDPRTDRRGRISPRQGDKHGRG